MATLGEFTGDLRISTAPAAAQGAARAFAMASESRPAAATTPQPPTRSARRKSAGHRLASDIGRPDPRSRLEGTSWAIGGAEGAVAGPPALEHGA